MDTTCKHLAFLLCVLLMCLSQAAGSQDSSTFTTTGEWETFPRVPPGGTGNYTENHTNHEDDDHEDDDHKDKDCRRCRTPPLAVITSCGHGLGTVVSAGPRGVISYYVDKRSQHNHNHEGKPSSTPRPTTSTSPSPHPSTSPHPSSSPRPSSSTHSPFPAVRGRRASVMANRRLYAPHSNYPVQPPTANNRHYFDQDYSASFSHGQPYSSFKNPSVNCTYGIAATAPNNKVRVKCLNVSPHIRLTAATVNYVKVLKSNDVFTSEHSFVMLNADQSGGLGYYPYPSNRPLPGGFTCIWSSVKDD